MNTATATHLAQVFRTVRGFTIIELMVVISIIVILIAITIPTIGMLGVNTSESAAINALSVAVEVARAHATRNLGEINLFEQNPQGINTNVPYSGAAAIFTPSGEIRIIEHDRIARRSAGVPYLADTNPTPAIGYRDIETIEYVRMPSGTVIKGFARRDDIDNLIDPPFAIRFDNYGHMVVGTDDNPGADTIDRYVIYDGDHDNRYNDSQGRPVGYTIGNYDPTTAWDPNWMRHKLPFERLECVVGVRIINPKNNQVRDLFFSRFTGTPMRNR